MKSGCPACERNVLKKYMVGGTDKVGNTIQILLTQEQLDELKNKLEIREVFE